MCNESDLFTLLSKIRTYGPTDTTECFASEHLVLFENCFQLEGERTHRATWDFSRYLVQIVHKIVQHRKRVLDDTASVFSNEQLALLWIAIDWCSIFGVYPHLDRAFQTQLKIRKAVFVVSNDGFTKEDSQKCLRTTVELFMEILAIKEFLAVPEIEMISIELMAGICSLDQKSRSEIMFKLPSSLSSGQIFKNLLILKSLPNMPPEISKRLHEELLAQLRKKGGFRAFALNLMITPVTEERPLWKQCEAIARVVSAKGHTVAYYPFIIEEIISLLFSVDEKNVIILPACVACLSKLYTYQKPIWRAQIQKAFDKCLQPLVEPEHLLAGAIIFEQHDFERLVRLHYSVFCAYSTVSLSSRVLIRNLPVFFWLSSMVSENSEMEKLLQALITQCLANLDKHALETTLQHLLFGKLDQAFNRLHERVIVHQNITTGHISLQIGNVNDTPYVDASKTLVSVLVKSNHNLLIYAVFIGLLQILQNAPKCTTKSDLLDEEDLETFISENFHIKYVLISTLSDLINHKPLHAQFRENPSEILIFLDCLIQERIAELNRSESEQLENDQDEMIVLILSLFLELIGSIRQHTGYGRLKKALETLRAVNSSPKVQKQIDIVLNLFEDEFPRICSLELSGFSFARKLCGEKESHLRVYGMRELIKLLKNKDEETLSNQHAILAIGLHCLRDEESYTYLNCVNLLTTLTLSLETAVIEMLIAEYNLDNGDIDFRLKIGEVIVKITENLGPLSYKYKDLLFNCFLRAAEKGRTRFRTSSLSNLATVCRRLPYQIHNVFSELLILVESIIATDTFVPARRGAVMVITEILGGFENLTDCQDFLLPTYRLLKNVVAKDQDKPTITHASMALQQLERLSKSFVCPEKNIEKEIRIVGIERPEIRTPSIVELSE